MSLVITAQDRAFLQSASAVIAILGLAIVVQSRSLITDGEIMPANIRKAVTVGEFFFTALCVALTGLGLYGCLTMIESKRFSSPYDLEAIKAVVLILGSYLFLHASLRRFLHDMWVEDDNGQPQLKRSKFVLLTSVFITGFFSSIAVLALVTVGVVGYVYVQFAAVAFGGITYLFLIWNLRTPKFIQKSVKSLEGRHALLICGALDSKGQVITTLSVRRELNVLVKVGESGLTKPLSKRKTAQLLIAWRAMGCVEGPAWFWSKRPWGLTKTGQFKLHLIENTV